MQHHTFAFQKFTNNNLPIAHTYITKSCSK